jgi:hypothetical protein
MNTTPQCNTAAFFYLNYQMCSTHSHKLPHTEGLNPDVMPGAEERFVLPMWIKNGGMLACNALHLEFYMLLACHAPRNSPALLDIALW